MGRMLRIVLGLLAALCCLQAAFAQDVFAPGCTFEGLRERYLSTRFLVQPVYFTTLGLPNHDWGYQAPNEFTPRDNFSVQWDGYITFPESGEYQFRVVHDDGFRIFLNNSLHCGAYFNTPRRTTTCEAVSFAAGQVVPFQVDYYDNENQAVIQVTMMSPSSSPAFQNLTLSMFRYSNCTVAAPNITAGSPISPQTGSGTVTLTLTKRPLGNVTVSLSSDCYYFERCLFIFSPDTWNVPITVAVYPHPDKPNGCCPIVATGVEGDTDFLGAEASLSLCKNLPEPDFGNTFGDPHLTTLDGTKYDFFDIGDYFFALQDNAELVVQTRQERCASASCNYAVAIRFKAAVLYMYLPADSNTPTVSRVGSFEEQGAQLLQIENGFRVLTYNGLDVRASVGLWQGRGIYYINVGLRVPQTFYGQLRGLAGLYDGRADNDWTSPDGSLRGNAFDFAKSWVVPDAQNLFLNAAAQIPPRASSSPSLVVGQCTSSPAPPPNNTASVPSEPGSPLGNEPVPQPNGTQTDCTVFDSPEEEASARANCEPYFNDGPAQCCAALGVDPRPYLETCLCDYNLADGPDFTAGNVQAFYDACSVRELATGTDCEACPLACSGNGDCVDGQCQCEGGFAGDSCSVPTSPPQITGLIPISLPFGCPSLVPSLTVSGSGFYGSMGCTVNGEATAATLVSAFQLLCALPASLPAAAGSVSVSVRRDNATSNTVSLPLVATCCASPCLNGGTCVGSPQGPSFTCTCPAGFLPPLCTPNPGCPATTTAGGASLPETPRGGAGPYTCPPGSLLQAEATCGADGFGQPTVRCVTPATCPPATVGGVTWPRTYAGLGAFGICALGFSGEPTQLCQANGTWAMQVQGSCTRNSCPASVSGTSAFPATPSLTTANGTCLLTTTGSPTRACNADGTWGPVLNPCVTAISCPATFLNSANYPATSGGTVSEGQCVAGYLGSPTRTCNADGSWGAELSSCQRAVCPAETVDGISFPATPSLTRASGSCSAGTGGTPARDCNADGTWGPIISSCFTCPAQDLYARASWPATPTGELAVGQCIPGWTGVPRRECFANGTWASYLSVLCTRLYCQPVTDGTHAFKEMEAGTQAYGSCVQGTGRPWRQCYLNGTFGPIVNPCTP